MRSLARLQDLALSESGFVFDPFTGATFTANPTGLLVLQGLRDGLSRSQIVEHLRQQFSVDGIFDQVESDVGDFVRLLVQQALLSAEQLSELLSDAAAGPAASPQSSPSISAAASLAPAVGDAP
ncbi:MAG TPA: PqqD family protein [Pseudomonadota bacterium]|nr:PqqD family protein [Pseudomonadota bacterium]